MNVANACVHVYCYIQQRENIVSSSVSVRCLAIPDVWRVAEQGLTLLFWSHRLKMPRCLETLECGERKLYYV